MKQATSSGVKLWNQAKELIPGGNQLLSKRSEMFLPGRWPSYYKKAKGVEIWDLDNKHYFDMSIMGIGTCVLGYANDQVNRAVKKAIDNGSMCTLNCYEEVALAKKLVKLHPWADMVRFARTGGEACAISVRIARAASKKDKVAFCGYHGWSDWYLSSNLGNSSNLDGQLLPGLQPKGVPRALRNTAFPFAYGNVDELNKIIRNNKGEVGTIIMEVERHKPIDLGFLKEVRKIATKIGAVLIYDEITSGFRLRAGGMHTLYGLEPDVVLLGKAMGNGYPIAVVLGKKKIMDAAQDTFISSTYWTERVGFTASLEVIRQFEENNVAKHLSSVGKYIAQGLEGIFAAHGLKIEIAAGMSPVPLMMIKEDAPLLVKTIFTQEMLEEGFLASNLVYVSSAHTKQIVDRYLRSANKVFKRISSAIRSNQLKSLLKGPVCHSGFSRLT